MRAAKHVAGLLGLMFTSGQALAAYQMNLCLLYTSDAADDASSV